MQRLLIERALGLSGSDSLPKSAGAAVSPPGPYVQPATQAPPEGVPTSVPAPEAGQPPSGETDPAASGEVPPAPEQQQQAEDSPLGNDPPELYVVADNSIRTPEPNQLAAVRTSRAARYLEPSPPRAARPVTWQDVDRITRLYEAGDAAHLVLQFGEYKGATLFQVAEMDPDYVRRLALSAQRPQVRAAARQMVVALEATARSDKNSRSQNQADASGWALGLAALARLGEALSGVRRDQAAGRGVLCAALGSRE